MRGTRNVKQQGISLVEVLVTVVVTALVCTTAYYFYRNFIGSLERQKQVTSLQEGIRTAVDCINRYLVAGGVSGDSLFFDPNHLVKVPVVNGGHQVFEVAADSSSLSVYGNYSGRIDSLTQPIVNKLTRLVTVGNPDLFHSGGYAYIYAGSAQEVIHIVSISGKTLHVGDNFLAYYPKGTLIYPFERVRVFRDPVQARLQVAREAPDGSGAFVRDFAPSSRQGDSLEFKVRSVDRQSGQVAYSLTFAAKTRKNVTLARRSEQTVFVRGF